MAGPEPYKHGYYLWKYVPSVAAAAIFCLVFAFATGAHIWRLYKTRTWMVIPFAISGFMEFIGYASRPSAHDKTGELMPFGYPRHARRSPFPDQTAEAYKLFVAGDVLSLTVQGSGAGIMVMGTHGQLVQALIFIGLAIQIVMFGVFCATAWLFHSRMRRDPVAQYVPAEICWEQILYMLYGVSALIMLRSVFRFIEFIMGESGFLLSNEWPLYIFDTVPMVAVMGIFWKWFPSTLKTKGGSISGTSMSNLRGNAYV